MSCQIVAYPYTPSTFRLLLHFIGSWFRRFNHYVASSHWLDQLILNQVFESLQEAMTLIGPNSLLSKTNIASLSHFLQYNHPKKGLSYPSRQFVPMCQLCLTTQMQACFGFSYYSATSMISFPHHLKSFLLPTRQSANLYLIQLSGYCSHQSLNCLKVPM